MAGNSAFELVSERGWRRGLDNLLGNELAHWWMTRIWWTQCLIWLGVIGFMLAAVLFLNHFFCLTLTLLLGSLFSSRGPVIGIALAFLFLQQYLVGLLPFLRYLLPWTLAVPLNNQTEAVVPALLLGQPVSSWIPVLAVLLESILFVLLTPRRFEREEF